MSDTRSPTRSHPPLPSLDAYWMPFTANRVFKRAPRMIHTAQGHYYTDAAGRQLLDGFSGLWTSGLGHCHPKIVAAVQKQVATLDYAMAFQIGHEGAFRLAEEVLQFAPPGFTHVFFTNSGSESADTSLKIAMAYHRAIGQATRHRMIGRERGYHGVNLGGTSVGGMTNNRRVFSPLLMPGVDHLRHTHDLTEMAFSHGQPQWGAHLADDLDRLATLHDPSTLAALIVEPVAGSAGVLVPPLGYLEKLRAACDRHGMLLIFDEVITGFGRVGDAFGANRFQVTPDIINIAKGLTNGVVPMGAVLVREHVYRALVDAHSEGIELFHGYTYSGHPLAAAAGLATMSIYREEGSFAQARAIEGTFGKLLHGLKGEPHVADIRNFGLMGGIDLTPRAGAPGARGTETFQRCWEAGVVIRASGDTLACAPFLDSTAAELERIVETVRQALQGTA